MLKLITEAMLRLWFRELVVATRFFTPGKRTTRTRKYPAPMRTKGREEKKEDESEVELHFTPIDNPSVKTEEKSYELILSDFCQKKILKKYYRAWLTSFKKQLHAKSLDRLKQRTAAFRQLELPEKPASPVEVKTSRPSTATKRTEDLAKPKSKMKKLPRKEEKKLFEEPLLTAAEEAALLKAHLVKKKVEERRKTHLSATAKKKEEESQKEKTEMDKRASARRATHAKLKRKHEELKAVELEEKQFNEKYETVKEKNTRLQDGMNQKVKCSCHAH